MTCVLSSTPWHHFTDHHPWLPMNSNMAPSEKPPSQGFVSPGSDTRKSSSSSGKKRASRAGTRSVTTLSAAQLERKRANDREAQRAIRQRTKDHIDHLERSLNEMRGTQESTEKLVHVTQQRNRELEEENAFLRNKLSEAGFGISLLASDNQRGPEPALLSVPSSSPGGTVGAGIQRPGSTSTPSSHSATTHSGSRHGSWQHQATGFVATSNAALGLSGATAIASAPNMSAWRSHEPGQTLQDPMHNPASGSYHQDQRVDWSGSTSSYQPFGTQEQQRPPQYETAQPQQPGYQPAVQAFGTSTTPQQSTYHSQLATQNEFPSISVASSPSTYHVQGQASLQPASFTVGSMQVPSSGTAYSSTHGPMQPPPLPGASFQTSAGDPAYSTQQAHGAIPYRDDSGNRPYSVPHFPAV